MKVAIKLGMVKPEFLVHQSALIFQELGIEVYPIEQEDGSQLLVPQKNHYLFEKGREYIQPVKDRLEKMLRGKFEYLVQLYSNDPFITLEDAYILLQEGYANLSQGNMQSQF